MELTERSVRLLVDYLYTGQIYLQSDPVLLLEVARAADCFLLQNVVSWIHGLVFSNVSEMVRTRRGYHQMGQMDLLVQLQSQQVTDWEDMRDSSCYLVMAGHCEGSGVSLYDPSVDLWSWVPVPGLDQWRPLRAALHRNLLFLVGRRLEECEYPDKCFALF